MMAAATPAAALLRRQPRFAMLLRPLRRLLATYYTHAVIAADIKMLPCCHTMLPYIAIDARVDAIIEIRDALIDIADGLL